MKVIFHKNTVVIGFHIYVFFSLFPNLNNFLYIRRVFIIIIFMVAESWTVKKAERRRIDAFELWCWRRCEEIQPVHSKGDQPWDFFGRNDAKAETPVLWPPHVKS